MTVAPLCFIDTETTSLDRYTRQVWEVAMVRREPDGTETSYEAFVEGVDLTSADPRSLAIGRFYDRYGIEFATAAGLYAAGYAAGDEYQHPDSVALAIERMTRGAHLVCAVPSFEDTTLAPFLRAHQLAPAWHYHLVCVENVLAGWFGVQPPYSSDELSKRIGVDPGSYDRHTAMGDVRWVIAQWDAWQREAASR